jgi:predicted DNA-binding protein YlxM (UPF0122 family)
MGIIYKLNFGNGDFYIGQTTKTIHARVTQHKSMRGKGSPLLSHAFEISELVGYEVLETAESDQLDSREQHWIAELKPPLNTTIGGKSTAGLAHPRLKYSKEQIEQVLQLYLTTTHSYQEIADITGVGYAMVHDITKRRAHTWVWETVDPKVHESARELRRVQFRVYDADNHEHEASSVNELCVKLAQPLHAVYGAIQGHKSARGLSLVKHPVLILTDPQLEQFELTVPRAREFLKTFAEISKFQLDQLTLKYKNSAGWTVQVKNSA